MTLLIALALALLCAGLAGSITHERGRGAGVGIGLGLLLSVIGVVIALLLPRRTDAQTEPQRYRECPHCREQLRRDASVCPHCRRDVDAWQLIDGRWWHQGSQGWHWLDENTARWLPGTPPTGEVPAAAAAIPPPPGTTIEDTNASPPPAGVTTAEPGSPVAEAEDAVDAPPLEDVDDAVTDDHAQPNWRRRGILIGIAGLLALTAAAVGLAVFGGSSGSGSAGGDRGATPAAAARKPAKAAPTRYGQLLPHGLSTRQAAAPACASYRSLIGRWEGTAATRASALAALPAGDAYAAADFTGRSTNRWVYANARPRFTHDLRLAARTRLVAATGTRARLITASMLDRFQADSLFACALGADARRTEQQLAALDRRTDELVGLAAAKPWYPQGWNAAPGDDSIAVRWDNSIGKCQGDSSYGYCWGMRVLTRDGCPNGLYAELNILSNGTIVDYSNDTTGSLSPGDEAELAFHSFEDGYGQLQGNLKEVNCY